MIVNAIIMATLALSGIAILTAYLALFMLCMWRVVFGSGWERIQAVLAAWVLTAIGFFLIQIEPFDLIPPIRSFLGV